MDNEIYIIIVIPALLVFVVGWAMSKTPRVFMDERIVDGLDFK